MGKTGLLLIFSLLPVLGLAQWQAGGWLEAGNTQVTNGAYYRLALQGGYRQERFRIRAAWQLDVKGPYDKVFTGSRLDGAWLLTIKNLPVWAGGYFIYNPYSRLVKETNWGVVASARGRHFRYRLGTGFRTYSLTGKGAADGQPKSSKIKENFILLYRLAYYLKPDDHHWNIGINLTNTDYFIINQSTNPVFFLQGCYRPAEGWQLFAEAWYKSAGAFNISVNYFGYFFRTGVVWKLK